MAKKLTPEQRARKNARERERRAAKRYAESMGITLVKGEPLESLYKRIDQEQIKAEKRARQRANYQATKELLENSGLPKDIITRHNLRNKSPATVQQFIDVYLTEETKVYTASQYIAILYFDKSGESYLGHSMDIIRGWKVADQSNAIKRTQKNMDKLKQNKKSYDFMGDYHLIGPGPYSHVQAEFDKRRGREGYEVLLSPTNQFSIKGFREMMAGVLEILTPWRKAEFYADMATYAEENLPEIYKAVF